MTLATRKIKRMNPLVRFEIDIWCIDLAPYEELAQIIIDVRYLLVRQNLFVETFDANGMTAEFSSSNFRAVFTVITKK